VYWVIFLRPASPSLRNSFRLGTVCDISCMMMDAEMYGMMPSANRERRSNAPPENMLNMSSMVPRCCSTRLLSTEGSIPGNGMKVPMRNTMIAPITNISR
jgi:hypothetical protein